MRGTKGWELTRQLPGQTWANVGTSIVVKLEQRALFGTFGVMSAHPATGHLLAYFNFIKGAATGQLHPVYPISVDVDIPTLGNVDKAGTLAVLRGMPLKSDLNAGTAVCINSVRTMLDRNFRRPGRYGLLIHCVYHKVVVVQNGRRQKYVLPPSKSASTQSRLELLLEIVFLGTEAEHASYTTSPAFLQAYDKVLAGTRQDNPESPRLFYAYGMPLEFLTRYSSVLTTQRVILVLKHPL